MITLTHLGKQFKHQRVFTDVTIEIPDGSIAYIKGVNGSGKSVFLRLISGYSKPTTGEIRIDGALLGKDCDFIPNAGLFINAPEFMKGWTGWENLNYLADIRKKATDQDILKLADGLKLSTDDLNKTYRHYSQGMRQKLRIIQAFMDEPQYLILDEPFDALDNTSRKLAANLILEYKKDHPNATIIFTSHDETAFHTADLVFMIDDQKVVPVEVETA